MSAHHRFEDFDQYVNPILEIIVNPNFFYLISPFTYGTVHSYLLSKKFLPEAEAAHLWKQMVCCVEKCHSKGIIVRDLKMSLFVFVDEERYDYSGYDESIIFYFGQCFEDYFFYFCRHEICLESLEDSAVFVNTENDNLEDKYGCVNYISPEKAESFATNKKYPGKVTDAWGLGVILYTMLVGA